MTWRDKLEIGLKDDAPFRRDNLPDWQKSGDGPTTRPDDPTRSPEEPAARSPEEPAAPETAAEHEGATEDQVGDRTGPAAGYDAEPEQVKDKGGVG